MSETIELSAQAMVICFMTLLYALGYVVKYFKNKKHKEVINDKKTSTNNVEKSSFRKGSVDQLPIH